GVWGFTAALFALGVGMGVGKAGTYKLIPEHFPRDVGAVGGLGGLLGALGGGVLPPGGMPPPAATGSPRGGGGLPPAPPGGGGGWGGAGGGGGGGRGARAPGPRRRGRVTGGETESDGQAKWSSPRAVSGPARRIQALVCQLSGASSAGQTVGTVTRKWAAS